MTRPITTFAALLATAGLSGSVQAAAVSAADFSWHVEGGLSAPTGQLSDYLQGGFIFTGGFTYAPGGNPLGLRVDLSFSTHDATNRFLNYGSMVTGVQVDSGTGTFTSLAVGPEYHVPFIGHTNLYGFAQAGVYYTSLQLTQTVLFQGAYCDPFWGFCDFGLLPGDNVVYDDSHTHFGWNVGVGIEFPTRYGPTYFVETGYHRLAGAQPMAFVPIEVGVRF